MLDKICRTVHNARMETRKTETVTVRLTKQVKGVLELAAKRDNRKTGSLCTIILTAWATKAGKQTSKLSQVEA